MQKGLLIGTAVVAFGAGIVLASSMWQSATQSELPVAALMPQNTAYYVDARDLRGLVEGVRKSSAWRDLQASGLLAQAKENEQTVALIDDLAQLSEEIGYALDEEAALKFLGADAAFAVWAGDDGDPRVMVVSRIDVAALAQDLLSADSDWRALQAELDRRAELAGVTVTTEEYAGYTISAAKRGERTTYQALVEDLLVLGNSRDVLVTAVDLRVAEGVGSLNELPAFSDELARLPADAKLRDWIHVDALKTAKFSFRGGVDATQLAPALDAISAPAVARAIDLPDNDLYQLGWTWSRTGGELFVDGLTPRMDDVIPEGALVRIEAQRLGQLVDAWKNSPIKEHLEGSWAAEKLTALFDEAADEALTNTLGSATAETTDLGDIADDVFWTQFGENLGRRSLSATLGGDAAVAVWRGESVERPVALWAIRLGTDGRLAEAAVRAVIDAQDTEGVSFTSFVHGTRTVRSLERDGMPFNLSWVTAGDVLLIGSTPEIIKKALDRADSRANAGDPAPADHGLPTDYRVLVTVSMSEYLTMIEDAIGDQPEPLKFIDWMRGYVPFDHVSLGIYVADDLSQIDFRSRLRLDAADAERALKPYRNVTPGAPRSFAVLPDRAIAAYASRFRIEDAFGVYDTDGLGDLMKPIREGIAEFEKALEVDLDEGILPALGDEVAFSILFEDQSAQPEAPPIPGVALLIGVSDQPVIADFLEKLADMGDEALKENSPELLIERDERGPTPAYRLLDGGGPGGAPVQPTLTFVGDFLVIALDDSTIDAMRAVADGTRRSHAASSLQTRVRSVGLPPDANEVSQFDWGVFLDQMAVYAPQLSGAFVDESLVPEPEFPDDDDMEEWNRRVAAYEQARTEQAAGKQTDVTGLIDSLRFIDFMAGVTTVTGDQIESHAVIRFKR